MPAWYRHHGPAVTSLPRSSPPPPLDWGRSLAGPPFTFWVTAWLRAGCGHAILASGASVPEAIPGDLAGMRGAERGMEGSAMLFL